MMLIPYKSYKINVALSSDMIKDKIQKQINPNAKGLFSFFIDSSESSPFKGKIFNNKFKLVRHIKYQNSFLPVIIGRITSVDDRSIIKLNMRLNVFASIFWSFWMFGIFTACLLVNILMKPENKVAGLLLFGLLIFGYFICIIPFNIEANKSKLILEQVFDVNLDGQ